MRQSTLAGGIGRRHVENKLEFSTALKLCKSSTFAQCKPITILVSCRKHWLVVRFTVETLIKSPYQKPSTESYHSSTRFWQTWVLSSNFLFEISKGNSGFPKIHTLHINLGVFHNFNTQNHIKIWTFWRIWAKTGKFYKCIAKNIIANSKSKMAIPNTWLAEKRWKRLVWTKFFQSQGYVWS